MERVGGATDVAAGLAEEVRTRRPPEGMYTRVVAVDGPGGAGKSTLAELLGLQLGGAAIVHTDDFASWENPVDRWPQILDRVLRPLAENRAAAFVPTWMGGPPKPRDGVHMRAQWDAWMEREDAYVARERPDLRADAVVPGDSIV